MFMLLWLFKPSNQATRGRSSYLDTQAALLPFTQGLAIYCRSITRQPGGARELEIQPYV